MAFKMKGFPKNGDPVKEVGMGGTKEYQDGKPVTKSLAEVREAISKERVEMSQGGATAAELKAFDIYQNKLIADMY